MVEHLQENVRMSMWLGLARSLLIYWRPGRQIALQRLYRNFIRAGDLVFDVGAHLGDRSWAFAALGARVVAIEPQPHVASLLRIIVRRQPEVTVLHEAIGRQSGTGTIAISQFYPTVSTLSETWRQKVTKENQSFSSVTWKHSAKVKITTLDRLIKTYGLPDFCKIDVEGYESEVIEGLTVALPKLSLEFVAGSTEIIRACVERLEVLGHYEFNAIAGENRHFEFSNWIDPEHLINWLGKEATRISSGDIYARLIPEPKSELEQSQQLEQERN